MKRESIDAGTQAWWVIAKRTVPAEDNRKGSKVPERTRQVAQYIKDNAPVRKRDVCHACDITEKSLYTQLTTITYLINVYEDDAGMLYVL